MMKVRKEEKLQVAVVENRQKKVVVEDGVTYDLLRINSQNVFRHLERSKGQVSIEVRNYAISTANKGNSESEVNWPYIRHRQ